MASRVELLIAIGMPFIICKCLFDQLDRMCPEALVLRRVINNISLYDKRQELSVVLFLYDINRLVFGQSCVDHRDSLVAVMLA